MDFSWDKLTEKVQKEALNDSNKSQGVIDERFYKLARDENDNGAAVIRFLPDPDGIPFIKMIQIAANDGFNRRFCNEWSPQTIGLPDPFNEKFFEEWNKGNKEEAKRFGRKFRYIANIKIVKDPANPSNNGKIFLLDMSPSLFEKIKNAADPSESERALGAEPMEVFNPIKGHNFLLKINKGSNGFFTYENSRFDNKVTSVYKSEEEYLKDIIENGYKLSEFLKPENFLSYDELKKKLAWYIGEDTTNTTDTESTTVSEEVVEESKEKPKKETPKKQPKEEPKEEIPFDTDDADDTDDLDDLLEELDD